MGKYGVDISDRQQTQKRNLGRLLLTLALLPTVTPEVPFQKPPPPPPGSRIEPEPRGHGDSLMIVRPNAPMPPESMRCHIVEAD